jgi:hypothetical protein
LSKAWRKNQVLPELLAQVMSVVEARGKMLNGSAVVVVVVFFFFFVVVVIVVVVIALVVVYFEYW